MGRTRKAHVAEGSCPSVRVAAPSVSDAVCLYVFIEMPGFAKHQLAQVVVADLGHGWEASMAGHGGDGRRSSKPNMDPVTSDKLP